MKLIFWTLLFHVSCTSNFSLSSKDRYEVMNDLWRNKANKSAVISALGANYNGVPNGIVYPFPSFNYPKSGHFFDPSGKVIVQFLFVPKERFHEMKKIISCVWSEKSESKAIGHTVQTVESGKCASENISYEYRPSMLLYEFRWETI